MRTRWMPLIFLFSLALGSCGSSQAVVEQSPDLAPLDPQEISSQEPGPASPENPLQLGNTPESAEMPPNPPPVEKFISLAKKDLASRLQMDAARISVVKTAEMVWPDAALGCPSPGRVYAQGRVPGYRVWLEVEGREYIYHTDLDGLVILCPEPDPLNPDFSPLPGSGPTPDIGVPRD